MRRRRWLISLVLLLTLVSVTSRVEAATQTMRGDKCEIAEDVIINQDFYFICRILDIRGTVNGDVIGAAAEVTIHSSATISGDLWIGGGKLVIAGAVGDDMHFGGMTMQIIERAKFLNPRVDVMAVALTTEISKNVTLPGDMLIYGYQVSIVGNVGGDVDFTGETLLLNGVVGGRVDATVGDARRGTNIPSLPIYDISFEKPGLWIGEDAYISGDMNYSANAPSLMPAGVVGGNVHFNQTGNQPDITKVSQADDAAKILINYIRQAFEDTLTLLLLGAIGLRLAPSIIQQPAIHVRERSVPTIGWGLITFMLSIPVVISMLLLGLLIVLLLYLLKLNELTLLLGIGVLIVTAVTVGLFSFLLFFMGRVVVSFMLGKLIERFAAPYVQDMADYQQVVLTMAAGAAVYTLITDVPLPAVGLIVELITALAGTGAVVMHLRGRLQSSAIFPSRATLPHAIPGSVQPMTIEFPSSAGQLPPGGKPALPTPGMENLPEGFTGFDEDW